MGQPYSAQWIGMHRLRRECLSAPIGIYLLSSCNF
jgi:hypothetical protein